MNREEQKQLEELKKRIEKLGNSYWLKEKSRQLKRGEHH
jgi:ABC-type hemin transport system substrate-binding protein